MTHNFLADTLHQPSINNRKLWLITMLAVLAWHILLAFCLIHMKNPQVKPTILPPLSISFIQNTPAIDNIDTPTAQTPTQQTPIEQPPITPPTAPKNSPKPMTPNSFAQTLTPADNQAPTNTPKQQDKSPIQSAKTQPNTPKPIAQQPEPLPQSMPQSMPQATNPILAPQQTQSQSQTVQQNQATKAQSETVKPEQSTQTQQSQTQAQSQSQTQAQTEKQPAIQQNQTPKAPDDTTKSEQSTSNETSVHFSAEQASWKKQPNFNCPSKSTDGETLTATFRYTVDKQGNATVIQSKSTGNTKADRQLLLQAKTAKFHPFLQNGTPVAGIVNLSVRCQ